MASPAPHDDFDDYAVVGRVARTHGHRGQVIVNPDTDFLEERFAVGSVFHVRRNGKVGLMRVTALRIHQGRPVIALDGVDTMTGAEELAGLELRVPVGELAELPPGMFYHHDLVGCIVETRAGERVGEVTAVEGDSSASRLVVKGEGGAGEVLVPLNQAICTEIDPSSRRVVIDPPEGLLEVNRRP